MSDLESRIIDVIAESASVEREALQMSATLEEVGIESVEVLEIIFGIEETFNITVPVNANDDEFQFDTVGDVVRMVSGLIEDNAA